MIVAFHMLAYGEDDIDDTSQNEHESGAKRHEMRIMRRIAGERSS